MSQGELQTRGRVVLAVVGSHARNASPIVGPEGIRPAPAGAVLPVSRACRAILTAAWLASDRTAIVRAKLPSAIASETPPRGLR